ncbi:hypothetical protein [Deinococcus pimensis]|uniref:hypothetical protein n=1 Tax=Deinococcus pimensis TaxID=309888 RepID=UPI0012FC16C9|nr:hypothetical protein [Deinococcus pimensis]
MRTPSLNIILLCPRCAAEIKVTPSQSDGSPSKCWDCKTRLQLRRDNVRTWFEVHLNQLTGARPSRRSA